MKRNPKDEELLKHIQIEKFIGHSQIYYIIKLNSKKIGLAVIYPGDKYIRHIYLDDPILKKRGIGTYVHDYIENDLGIILESGENLSADAKAFWKKRIKKNPVIFNRDNLKRWLIVYIPKLKFDVPSITDQLILDIMNQLESSFDIKINPKYYSFIFRDLYYHYLYNWYLIDKKHLTYKQKLELFEKFVENDIDDFYSVQIISRK